MMKQPNRWTATSRQHPASKMTNLALAEEKCSLFPQCYGSASHTADTKHCLFLVFWLLGDFFPQSTLCVLIVTVHQGCIETRKAMFSEPTV
jgi:hypothetical protein